MTAPAFMVDWPNIDAVIFDVDGTLFDLVALRKFMALRLAQHLFVPGGCGDVRIVKTFRALRETLSQENIPKIGRRQFEIVARELQVPAEEVERVVVRWMQKAPLKYLPRCAPSGVQEFFRLLGEASIKIGVFSDYPAEEKLAALSLRANVILDATMPAIGYLKPNPAGFVKAADALGVAPDRCLIIGDRDDRDGLAAQRGGFNFVRIVAKSGRASGYERLADGLRARGIGDVVG